MKSRIVERGEEKEKSRTKMSKDDEIESLVNPVACTALLLITILYVMLVRPLFEYPVMPFPLDMITVAWFGIFLAIWSAWCYKEGKRYTGPDREELGDAELDMKHEFIRKSTHLVIIAVFICYTVIGNIFINTINFFLSALSSVFPIIPGAINVDPGQYGHYVVLFFTMISFLGMATSEVTRVFFYPLYPLKMVKAIYRRKERGAALGSHVSLTVGCMSAIMLFGPEYPEIVMASIAISALADATANIVGKRFGRHDIKTVMSRRRKTLEGLVTAIIVSFALSMFFLIYRFGLLAFPLAFFATLVMALVDWVSPQVSDNLVNPVLTSMAMVLAGISGVQPPLFVGTGRASFPASGSSPCSC